MIMRHDIQKDLYRFEDETCSTSWYQSCQEARAAFEKIRLLPEERIITRSALDLLGC